MENHVSSKSVMINYGATLAIVSILINLLFYATGTLLTFGWLMGLIGFAAMVIIIIFGIKNYKAVNSGFLSFSKAVKIGVGISIFSALISVIYSLIFNNFIDPDFQETAMEIQRQAWEEANMTSEQIEVAEGMAETFSSPAITYPVQVVVAAFFGFIISAIGGAIMKKAEDD